jgi:hypothetical protein
LFLSYALEILLYRPIREKVCVKIKRFFLLLTSSTVEKHFSIAKRAKRKVSLRRKFSKWLLMIMKCISNKKMCNSLVLLIFLTNLQFSTSSLSTTVSTTLSTNFSSHEPTCLSVKDLFTQRGIAEKDIPKTPIKGKNFLNFLAWRRMRGNKLVFDNI